MYDFRTLSPLDFEELIRDLLQAEFGLRFESFGPGRDQGIDFRFATAWTNPDGSPVSSPYRPMNAKTAVVQAKHYVETGINGLVRAARSESVKAAKLKPDRYLFATSVSLTPESKDRLMEALDGLPVVRDDVLGREDLNNLLGRHPEIEKQHFKLWLASEAVLQRILHSGVYNRTQAEMDHIRDMVPKFVTNRSVPEAEAILQKHGALIIAGEPGVGKSTLARMLVWLHAEQDWRIYVVDDIKEAFEISDEGQKRLIFFDDFLGQIGLTKDLIQSVDQRFEAFFRRVKNNKNLRFILTTRDYILRQAQAQSRKLSAPEVNASEFVLNVGHYTRETKAKILFNHLYFSDLPQEQRKELLKDDFFLKIIDHKNFNPRLIDLLTNSGYVELSGKPIREAVQAVLNNPHELWEKPYRSQISEEGRALMVALFFNDHSVSRFDLERSFERMVQAMGFSFPKGDMHPRFRAAMRELEGSVIDIEGRDISFSNPGVRDFLQRVIHADRLTPAVIDVVTEFDEVKQTWQYFIQQGPKELKGHQLAPAWTRAMGRLIEADSGTPLRRLELVIDCYDRLQADALLPLVRRAIADLRDGGISHSEADRSTGVLEMLVMTLLPMDEQKEAKKVVTEAIAHMLSEWGFGLNLDQIRSVSEALFDYGADQDLAASASRAALESYLEDLESTLGDMSSVDQIEEYERELRSLMTDYGIQSSRPFRQIEDRKETLAERERWDDDERYGSRGPTPTATMSDEQIRSMFKGLKG